MWITEESAISHTILNHFQQLYHTSHPQGIADCLYQFPSLVTSEMNASLTQPITAAEIKKSVFSINPWKVPGIDGYTSYFFPSYWDIMGELIIKAVQDFFSKGHMLRSINHIVLALISKIKWHQKYLISDQSAYNAFVKDRVIADSILLVHESSSPSILMAKFKAFMLHPEDSRGSFIPFAFVLCAQGLSFILDQAVLVHHLQGLKVSRNGPMISHLLFADDLIIFSECNMASVTTIQNLLHRYALASGQIINFAKSEIFFSSNSQDDMKTQITHRFNIQNQTSPQPYLGIPTFIGSSKTSTFNYVIHKIQHRLNGWKEIYLSIGGKEVLIKAIINAIPIYTMMCFKLPKGLCNKINQLVVAYWWGQQEDENKIFWIAWSKMCASKWSGGMEFKDFHCFDQALLAKQIWRLMHASDSLMFIVVKDRYFPNTDMYKASLRKKSFLGLEESVFWPTITQNRFEMVLNLRNTGGSSWNELKLHSLFSPKDVALILAMPILVYNSDDRLIWHHTNTGEYSVKSGYHIALSNAHSNSSLFNLFWQQKIGKIYGRFISQRKLQFSYGDPF
ncbi:uncharacterized protein LOC126687555 [Mercurialis annua]|uniref:uncharacterized protein LOC126687555 n=1 Tax=Mercurialis annua TaxID=3986 RepID=UPI002160C879|nr:uncharacterized protein LOC126687555 [Mercurialis annua]